MIANQFQIRTINWNFQVSLVHKLPCISKTVKNGMGLHQKDESALYTPNCLLKYYFDIMI